MTLGVHSKESSKTTKGLLEKGSCRGVRVEMVKNPHWGGDSRWDVQG